MEAIVFPGLSRPGKIIASIGGMWSFKKSLKTRFEKIIPQPEKNGVWGQVGSDYGTMFKVGNAANSLSYANGKSDKALLVKSYFSNSCKINDFTFLTLDGFLIFNFNKI